MRQETWVNRLGITVHNFPFTFQQEATCIHRVSSLLSEHRKWRRAGTGDFLPSCPLPASQDSVNKLPSRCSWNPSLETVRFVFERMAFQRRCRYLHHCILEATEQVKGKWAKHGKSKRPLILVAAESTPSQIGTNRMRLYLILISATPFSCKL